MALLNDLIDPTELTTFVRELEFPDLGILDEFLPNTTTDNIEYEVMRDTRADVDAAEYRSFDAEAGIGKRPGLSKLRGKIPPISRKVRLGEEERLRNEAFNSGTNQRLIDAIFDDAANMARSVVARRTLAKGQALSTGKVTIAENGVVAEAAYGVPAGHIVTAGASWATTTTPIISHLTTWMATYRASNRGLNPGGMILSTQVLGYMLLNDQFRSLLASLSGAPSLITRQGVDQVLQAYGLPPIRAVVDTQVMVNGVATYVLPQDEVILVPPPGFPLGETPHGITAEALELREGGQISGNLSGLIATVAKTEFDPVATWTKAAALTIPVIANPTRLFIAHTTP